MTTENEFVRDLASRFPVRPPVEVGIGDDGAVVLVGDSERIIVVTDMLLDGVHFDLRQIAPRLAGRKAVAVNLSDLAAMACRPTAAFVSIAVPKSMATPAKDFLDDLYFGIKELTDQYEFCLAGGDTNSWQGPFAINVCLTGTPFSKRPILRSGARPGDVLYVTGPLGGSLRNQRHLTFRPRLDAAEWLADNVDVHAMMDLSDGLSVDLLRMMDASGTGAVLQSRFIPIHADVVDDLPFEKRLSAALNDGEDFELLISVSSEEARDVQQRANSAGLQLFEVGTVTDSRRCWIRGDQRELATLHPAGWQHAF